MLLKQPNSLEVDRAELRKTKSAEAMSMAGFLAPTIVIGNYFVSKYCLRHKLYIVSGSIADVVLAPTGAQEVAISVRHFSKSSRSPLFQLY